MIAENDTKYPAMFFGRKHPYFRDKGIRGKKERFTVLMNRMVVKL